MGCDIHLFVEVNKNGQWVSADTWRKEKDEKYNHVEKAFYDERNYNLFSWLAGVRKTHNIIAISPPRGFPTNCSPEVQKQKEIWDTGAHAYSYFTLEELQNAISFKPFHVFIKYILLEDYLVHGKDPNYGSTSDNRCNFLNAGDSEGEKKYRKIITSSQADLLLISLCNINEDIPLSILSNDVSIEVECEWRMSNEEICGEFLSDTIPKLRQLGEPKDVRIIFWFDN